MILGRLTRYVNENIVLPLSPGRAIFQKINDLTLPEILQRDS